MARFTSKKARLCVSNYSLYYSALQFLLLSFLQAAKKMRVQVYHAAQAIKTGLGALTEVIDQYYKSILLIVVAPALLKVCHEFFPRHGYDQGLGFYIEQISLFDYYLTIHWYLYVICEPLAWISTLCGVLFLTNHRPLIILSIGWQISRIILFTSGSMSNDHFTRESIGLGLIIGSFLVLIHWIYSNHKSYAINYDAVITGLNKLSRNGL